MKISSDVRFSTVPEWLIYSEVSAQAVRLWAVLDRHADKTGRAVPGQGRLGKLMHASVRTIGRATEELEKVGAVTVMRAMGDDGVNRPNEYRLHLIPHGIPTEGMAPAPDPLPHGRQGGMAPVSDKREVLRKTPERTRDPAFDALASETGSDLQGLTRSAARATGVALAEIAQAEGSRRHLHGPAPHDLELAEEIAYRAGRYRQIHPDWQLTAPSLAKYWATLRVKTVEKVSASVTQMRDAIPDDDYDPGEPISEQYARLRRDRAVTRVTITDTDGRTIGEWDTDSEGQHTSRQAAESAPDQAGGSEAGPPAAEGSGS